MSKKNDRTTDEDTDEDFEYTMEDAKGFVCDHAVDAVFSNGVDCKGSVDEDGVMCLRDECNTVLKICNEISKCKNEKSIRKVLLKHYSKKEVEEVI